MKGSETNLCSTPQLSRDETEFAATELSYLCLPGIYMSLPGAAVVIESDLRPKFQKLEIRMSIRTSCYKSRSLVEFETMQWSAMALSRPVEFETPNHF
jgi:hypothetical protein